MRRPDLVRRLVLLEANEGGGSVRDAIAFGDYLRPWTVPFASRNEARAALGDGPLAQTWVDDLEERADGLYPRFDPDVMVRAIMEVSVPRWAEWESVTAPTLVIYADGGMFTDDQKTAFIRRGSDVARIDLTDASHDAHLDSFEQWIAALSEFIGLS